MGILVISYNNSRDLQMNYTYINKVFLMNLKAGRKQLFLIYVLVFKSNLS